MSRNLTHKFKYLLQEKGYRYDIEQKHHFVSNDNVIYSSALQINTSIRKMKQIIENQHAQHLLEENEESAISIDEMAIDFVKKCDAKINELKKHIAVENKAISHNKQVIANQNGILACLMVQLEHIVKVVSKSKLENAKRENQQKHSAKVYSDIVRRRDTGKPLVIPTDPPKRKFLKVEEVFADTPEEYDLRGNADADKGRLQELKEENLELIQSLTTDYELAQAAQKQLFELSNLLSNFTQKVNEQEIATQSILVQAEESNKNIEKANAELKKAKEHQKGYGRMWASIFFGMALVLLFFDWKTTMYY